MAKSQSRGTELEQVNYYGFTEHHTLQTKRSWDAVTPCKAHSTASVNSTASATVKKNKLQWFGHVSRAKGALSQFFRVSRSWITDLKEWTGLTANQMARLAEDLAKHHAAPTAD
ncbi:hypothetical protein Bbelb_025250 [Branchiostoma belcheri]|nr:hypothetical protein Bbelb_025250 [Branchiostoma belcheri]